MTAQPTPGEIYSCSVCGVVTTTGLDFVKPTLRGRAMCGSCVRDLTERSGDRQALRFWLVALATLTLSISSPDNVIAWALRWWLLFYAIEAAMTILHELGHAVTATMLGLRVEGIKIGIGPRVLGFTVGRRTFDLHALPVSGHTKIDVNGKLAVTRFAIAVFAGPAVEASVLLGAWLWSPPTEVLEGIRRALLVIISLNLVLNLFPWRPRGTGGSDGSLLVQSIFGSTPDTETLEQTSKVTRTVGALSTSDRPDAETIAEARAALEEHLETPGIDAGSRALSLNNLAWTHYLSQDPELLAVADGLSAEALSLMPHRSELAGTRGAVLASLGRYGEAVEALRMALARSGGGHPANHEAMAVAMAGNGNAYDARSHLLAAMEAGHEGPLHQRAIDVLGELETRNLADRGEGRDAAAVANEFVDVARAHAAVMAYTILNADHDASDVPDPDWEWARAVAHHIQAALR